MPRNLILNAFLMTTGHHEASWRLPGSATNTGTDIAHYQRLAQLAESAKFDAVFFADSPVLQAPPAQRPAGALDPILLLTALATVTKCIGLIATASTSYNDPYNLAREFATLDTISHGRAGWNVVTTAGDSAAKNFSQHNQLDSSQRYARAGEFLEAAVKLWDSWEDDAAIGDKQRGIWADPQKIHQINHRGQYFQIDGPLNLPRSPQGRPVIIQAGASPAGRNFAAQWAEAIFAVQQSLEQAQGFYSDVKQRVAAAGRDPEAVKVLPGIVPIIGSTEQEAAALADELDALILPEHALKNLSAQLHIDPAELKLDEKLPAGLEQVVAAEKSTSRRDVILQLGYGRDLTVRQILRELGPGRGHQSVVGTPEQIAGHIEESFTQRAADGFNIMAPVLPSGLEVFIEQVVPILQQRGLFRTEYSASTLRGHYGLPRPDSIYAGKELQLSS
ncbi:UNVERIFIED_CONTAM: LLM class flavin-dependent oxidoreductase [Actinomycetes bacterium ARC8]|nr:LLM class flavin-dependent oxidoreductase [Actinomycetes bacterium ARC8]